MKYKIELTDGVPDEVIIRCSSLTPEIRELVDRIASFTSDGEHELALTLGGTEYFISEKDIIFFETDGSKTAAHTVDRMYYSSMCLRELESILPLNFVRGSKSSLINVRHISQITKNLTGASEVLFFGTNKKIYVSRMYYKPLRERIDSLRLNKGQ